MVDLRIQLPEGFLDEEVRCGYTVTHEMKKVWAVMLDLLAEFDRVCKKHHLRYQASWGTMLGAVRHKGFIPWDDDLDVQMFRDDYEKLCKIASSEFQHPYFFQSKITDPGMDCLFCKLRNSETTALSHAEKHNAIEYNKGIFIDIFPIDNIPDCEEEKKSFFLEIREKRREVITKGRNLGVFSESENMLLYIIKKTISSFLKQWRKTHLSDFLRVYKEMNVLCEKYNNIYTEKMAMLMYYPPEANIMLREDYQESVMLDFEFLKIPVAKGYNHALEVLYGDYHKFYIKESHSAYFNTEKSYLEYHNN